MGYDLLLVALRALLALWNACPVKFEDHLTGAAERKKDRF